MKSTACVLRLLFVIGLGWPVRVALGQTPPVAMPNSPSSPLPQEAVSWKASLSGTVRDAHGSALPQVRVTIIRKDQTAVNVARTDSNGLFTFSALTPDTYRLRIDQPGLAPFVSGEVVLGAGENGKTSIVARVLPKTRTTIDVSATVLEIAQEQVKEQESQRIFGFLPNYYTSYVWNAAPMTPKLKMHMAFKSFTDPATLLVVASIAGVEQAHKTFPGYGQGVEGYAKRLGGTYADTVSGRVFSSAIYPMLFHQDPRYFYQGSGTVRSRIAHALASTFICRGDNGQLQPNYSHVLGSFTAAGVSNLYRSSQDRQASTTFRNGLIITAGSAVVNVMREFLSRQLTPSVPGFANGKP